MSKRNSNATTVSTADDGPAPAIGLPELDATPARDDVPGLPLPESEPESGDAPATPSEPPRSHKRKRGRPRKVRPDEPPAPTRDPNAEKAALAQAMGMAFSMGGRIVAAAKGPHWTLAGEESAVLGECWAEALAPYMDSMSKWLPIATALTVTAGVIAPRVQADRERERAGKLASAEPASAREVARPLGVPVAATERVKGFDTPANGGKSASGAAGPVKEVPHADPPKGTR